MNKYNLHSRKMYRYLYEDGVYPYDRQYYYFLLINFKQQENGYNFLETLAEMLASGDIIVVEDNYLIFYFEQDIKIKDIFLSLTLDFGIAARAFDGGKINGHNRADFHAVYQGYKKFIRNTSYNFSGVVDLIIEMVKKDITGIKSIKSAILKEINGDSQMERLITVFFDSNLNVSKTAKHIYMHRNTVINKIEYIRNKTGLNIQNFTDALCMYWLIKIK